MTHAGPPSNGLDQPHPPSDPRQAGDPSLAQAPPSAEPDEAAQDREPQAQSEGPLTRLTGLGADTGQRLAALSARLDTLADSLGAQEDRLRDAERSLVDRIADVDDDRRRTLAQIQRAVQAQSEDVEGRVRRLGGLTTLGLLLIAALAAGGLLLMHLQGQQRLEDLQGDLTGELQTLGLELSRLKGGVAEEGAVQQRLTALSAAIDRVSADLAVRQAVPESGTPAEPPRLALLAEQVARLESDQQGLTTEVETLRQGLDAATQPPPEPEMPAEPPKVQALSEQIGRLESDQQALIAEIEALRRALDTAPAAAPDAATAGDARVAEATEVTAQPVEPQIQADPEDQTRTGSEPEIAASTEGTGEAEAPSTDLTTPMPDQAAPSERRFALQLMGSYDREAMLAMAARADLPATVFLRQETLRGRPWFVLIHSLHPTYTEAEAERDRLPADLPKRATWIRDLPPEANLEPIPTGRTP